MNPNTEKTTAVIPSPPALPSHHFYWSLAFGIFLPLLIAFVFWKRVPAATLSISKLYWAFLWTYPLMVVGCLFGEFIARRVSGDFYASIGDNPGQIVNLFTGWLWAHLYLILLVAVFFLSKKTANP